jgi:hypothetical protein
MKLRTVAMAMSVLFVVGCSGDAAPSADDTAAFAVSCKKSFGTVGWTILDIAPANGGIFDPESANIALEVLTEASNEAPESMRSAYVSMKDTINQIIAGLAKGGGGIPYSRAPFQAGADQWFDACMPLISQTESVGQGVTAAQLQMIYPTFPEAGTVNGTGNTRTRSDATSAAPQISPPVATTFAELDARGWAQIVKDPAACIGQGFIVYGEVTQFDAATGTTAFLASAAASDTRDYGYFQGDNSLFMGSKEILAPVVQADVFTANVICLGSVTYDTQIGGSTTVPQFQVSSIQVIP